MSSFVTIIPKNSGASAPNTVWKQQAGGRSLIDFISNKKTRKVQHTTSRHKTNAFEVFNMEESTAAVPSKTWKRAPLGKWGKSNTIVMQAGSFTEKKQTTPPSAKVKDCRYCHENHDIRNKRGDISCPKLKRKLQYDEEQQSNNQNKKKLGRHQRMLEKQAVAAELLRQQFEAAKIQVDEPEILSEESDDDTGYDQSLQCDEELRSVPTDEELIKAKLLNRIQQVEAELTEAREELESEKSKKTSWADAGDVEDAELRVECLEDQVERLKKKL